MHRTDVSTANRSDLSHHILPSSATMLGVCMMVISIAKLLQLGSVGLAIDRLLALDSMLFLASAGLSYLAMRPSARSRFERCADAAFMLGLVVLGICSVLLAFEIR